MLCNIFKRRSCQLNDIGKEFLKGNVKDIKRISLRAIPHVMVQRGLLLNGRNLILKARKLTKSFHHQPSKLSVLSPELNIDISSNESIKQFRKKNDILVQGKNNNYEPILRLEEANFPDFISKILQKYNISKPTPIQSEAWPIVLEGRDMVAISPTGSGKTLGYVLPAVSYVETCKAKGVSRDESDPLVLILSPTRELCQQIEQVVRWFVTKNLRCCALFGGSSKKMQIRNLLNGVEICVATPGRLQDLVSGGHLSLNHVSYVVLDEADRMLDMGFLPDIKNIFDFLKAEKKQVIMWSATWPKEVKEIAHKFMEDYILLSIGPTELRANCNVTQIVKVVDNSKKYKELAEILKGLDLGPESPTKVLIFCETKLNADFLFMRLNRGMRINCGVLHGDHSQSKRDMTLKRFRSNLKVLVATEVMARGIDVMDITHIINYDAPAFPTAYIHRIGRTGRMNSKGTAITFVTPDASKVAAYLTKVLRDCNQNVPEQLLALTSDFKDADPFDCFQNYDPARVRFPSKRPRKKMYGSPSRYGSGFEKGFSSNKPRREDFLRRNSYDNFGNIKENNFSDDVFKREEK